MSFATCRFCEKGEFDADGMVKYAVRHYAHYRCFLEAGKPFSELYDWQKVEFPFRLLREFNLMAEAEAAAERINARHDR